MVNTEFQDVPLYSKAYYERKMNKENTWDWANILEVNTSSPQVVSLSLIISKKDGRRNQPGLNKYLRDQLCVMRLLHCAQYYQKKMDREYIWGWTNTLELAPRLFHWAQQYQWKMDKEYT